MEEESKDTSYAKLMEMNREKDDSDNDVEIIRQKFQRVAMKIQGHIVQKACDRLDFCPLYRNDTLDNRGKSKKMLDFVLVSLHLTMQPWLT